MQSALIQPIDLSHQYEPRGHLQGLTCRGVGKVEREAGDVDVGIIVPTDGFYGLQAEGGRLRAHPAVQVAGCPPLWQKLLCA